MAGIVGNVKLADGSSYAGRLGRLGEQITGNAVGKYYELAKQGQLYVASMQAGAALGVALTATAVTLTLANPATSTVNLSLLQTAVSMTASQTTTATGESIVYAFDPTFPTSITYAKIRPVLLGTSIPAATLNGAGSQGIAATAATLAATPIVVRVHPFNYNCFTTNAAGAAGGWLDEVDGALVLGPGTSVTLQGLATTTGINGILSMMWAEIPV